MYWPTPFGLLDRFLLAVRDFQDTKYQFLTQVPNPRSLDWEIHDYTIVTEFVNGLRYYTIYAIEAHEGAIDQEWEGEERGLF